ncbi:ribonuclease H-like domain-containing protein, partial [Tanacetum coccineum]
MQKYILKQLFEGFSVSNTEGLHKGYDRSLPSAGHKFLNYEDLPGVDILSFDDLYYNLRVFESNVKGSTASSSSPQNVAFVSENTSSTNDVSTAYSVPIPSGQNSQYEQTSSYSLLANQSSCPQLDHEDLEQIDEYDLEEMDLKWQVAMILHEMKFFLRRLTGHFARECRIKGNQDNRRRDAWNSGTKDGSRTGKKEDSKALVTIDGEGVDWSNQSEDEDYALMACNSSDSDTEVISCSNKCKESYANLKKLYDAQREQLSDASIEIKAYSQGLKKVEAQLVAHQQGQLWYEQKIKFMKIDLDDKTDVLTYHKKLLAEAQKEKEDLKAKVEKWHNSSKNLIKTSVFMIKESDLKPTFVDRFGTTDGDDVPPPMTGNYMPSGPDIKVDYSQFTYEPSELVSESVVNESNVDCQPKVWSDAPIIEEYESDSEDEYVSTPIKEKETPSFANQQVKTPRETVKNQCTHSQKSKVDKKELGYRFTVRACFVCGSLNHLIRDCDFHEKRMARKAELNNDWNNVQRVNKQNQFVPSAVLTRTGKIPVSTARASSTKNVSTARQSFNRQTILTSTAIKVNTVKPIMNRFRPANGFENLFTLPQAIQTRQQHLIGNKAYPCWNFARLNGGCWLLEHFNLFSVSQMCDKKNKVLFTDTECLVLSPEFKLPDENQVLLKIPRQNNMYSFNLENIVPSGGLACLIAKATTDESNKWHRRLGHVNFKNLNKLVKRNLVRGLPSKIFQNDHTCVACQKGKQHKASCRFSLAFLLRTKDETSAIRKDFIRQIKNQLNQKVKTIRSDNGTEFKNKDVIEFCGSKGIKREYSNARNSTQKGTEDSMMHWNSGRKKEKDELCSKTDFVYQMDVKSAFLYGKIDEEVYVSQPPAFFLDPKYPQKVYKVVKALYGLHQAPRAWYATLSTFLLKNGYRRDEFNGRAHFLSWITSQTESRCTPIMTQKSLVKDEDASDVDVHLYRSLKVSHLSAVREFLGYLKGKPKLGNPQQGGCQYIGRETLNFLSNEKKSSRIVAASTTEAEYVAAASCCGQSKNSLVKHFEDMRLCRPSKEYLPSKLVSMVDDEGRSRKVMLVNALRRFRESLRRVTDGTEAF